MAVKTSELFWHLWLTDLCQQDRKTGPATLRRWYFALSTDRLSSAANDNPRPEPINHEAAEWLVAVCRSCKRKCDLPLG